MPNLNSDQIASVEAFIGKIEDSAVKSKYEKWLAEVKPTERVTSEQLEQFVALSTHLPKEVQNFPQSFVSAIKNTPDAEKREAREGTKETADLLSGVDESIAKVSDVKAPKNEEETLHKLGTKDGSKGGKKISKAGGKVSAKEISKAVPPKSKPIELQTKPEPRKSKPVAVAKGKPILLVRGKGK